MLKYKVNCKICNAIKDNPKLMKRIYDSSYFIPHSKDSLRKIALDCEGQFSYLALLNHVKKHQHLNAEDYNSKMMQYKAKKAEMKIIEDRFEAQHVQDAIINQGMANLEKGVIHVTADNLLRAAKDKQDALAKKRDQQLQLAEMVAFYTSGEDQQKGDRIYDRRKIVIDEYDPAIPVAEYPDSGEI